MNTQDFRKQHQVKQSGASMVELMVALLVVSFLMIAMVAMFLSSRSSFIGQEQVGRMQENGRYAFSLITKEIERAGYRPEVWEPPRLGFAFTVNTTNGSGTNPDTIELQFESDEDCLGAFNPVTRAIVLPDGTTVNVPRHDQRLVSFSILNDELIYVCSYGPRNGALVEQINTTVAEGIENLQIQYGEDLTNDLSVNNWVNAGGWNNMSDIVAVRIAMSVRTPEIVLIEDDTRTHDLYSHTTTAAGDQRIRRVYSGLISVRNLTL